MDILTKTYNETLFISHVLNKYFGNLRFGFLDIETTGLNSTTNKIFLVGILTVHKDHMTMTQLFADSKEEEKDILIQTVSLLSDLDFIMTYNGSSFDIPFLNKRFHIHNIEFEIPSHASFDLYKIIKRYGYNLFSNYKLKTIENYLGINRKDTLSGKECLLLYNDYVKNKNITYKSNILLHNREDIYYLSKILPVLNKYDLHKIFFENNRFIGKNIIITHSGISYSSIILSGFCSLPKSDYSGFTTGYNFSFDFATKAFHLTIPLYEEDELYYLDLSEFPIDYMKKNPHSNLHEHILLVGKKKEIDYLELNAFIEKLVCYVFSNI